MTIEHFWRKSDLFSNNNNDALCTKYRVIFLAISRNWIGGRGMLIVLILTSPGTWKKKKKKIESKGELEDKRDHLDKSDLSQQFIVVTEAS